LEISQGVSELQDPENGSFYTIMFIALSTPSLSSGSRIKWHRKL